MGKLGQGSSGPTLAIIVVPCVLLGYYFLGYQRSARMQSLGGGRRRSLLDSSGFLGEPVGMAGTCRVESFRNFDPATCMDRYNHPFSGCLSESYEAETIARLREGRPVSDLRCGFVDSPSQRWLSRVAARYAHCTYVLYVISFSYGTLPGTKRITSGQEGVCFVAFVDEAVRKGLPAYNVTHSGRWQVEVVDPTMLADTSARASKLLRILAPRLFPASHYSFYIDYKVKVPADPLGIFRTVEASSSPFVVVTVDHPTKGRDIFGEGLAVLSLLTHRRLGKERSSSKRNGVKGRDFDDVFRQFEFFQRTGYPMHHTGMMDAALLIWDHQNSCTSAFMCMWHNQVAYFSMRVQLNFNYVVSMMGLNDQVLFLKPFSYSFRGTNFTLQPTGWPAFGDLKRDAMWR